MVTIGEWMVTDILRNTPLRSDVKRSVFSFLRGGYIASGGMVGSIFSLAYRYCTFFDPVADVSIEGERRTVILRIKDLSLNDCLDGRISEIVREFTIDEVGKPYEFYRNEMLAGLTYILYYIARHASQLGECVVLTCINNEILRLE